MTMLFATNCEKHRIERLRKVLLIVREVLSISESQAALLIYDLNDEKGLLTVSWSAEPTTRQFEAFATAWGLVGEVPGRIVHHCADAGLGGWSE